MTVPEQTGDEAPAPPPPEKYPREPRATELLAAAFVLFLATLLLHGSALSGFFRADDGDHLRFALSYTPLEYFFLPEINQAHHTATLTPWNVFFYEVNLSLSGFAPRGHYLHQISLIAAAAWLLFMVLRNWLSGIASLAGAVAFLTARPTIHIAQYLMTGHYATGLVFCLAAVSCWIRFVKGARPRWIVAGAACYAAATLCKEVCVPLIVLLPFLEAGTPRRRKLALIPFLFVALAYTFWRRLVLGVFVGGGSPTGEGLHALDSIRQILRIPYILLGRGSPGIFLVSLLAAGCLVAFWNRRIQWRTSIALVSAAVIPLIPLTIRPGISAADRYLFFPAVVLAAALAFLTPRRGDPWWSWSPVVILLPSLLAGHVLESRGIEPELGKMDALYRFALEADPRREGVYVEGDTGYLMTVLPAAVEARNIFNGRLAAGKLVVLTDTPAVFPVLCAGPYAGKTFYRYAGNKMQPITQGELEKAIASRRHALERGQTRELRVALSHDSGVLNWEFGPWEGEYWVNLEEGGVRLPRKGTHPWSLKRALSISVCFEGSGDWVACSPRFRFDPQNHSLSWSGHGDSCATSRKEVHIAPFEPSAPSRP